MHARSYPHIILKSHQRPVCFSFRRISLIISGSCNHSGSGTGRWILIPRTRLLILPNNRRPFWGMYRTTTVPNIDECPSWNSKMFRKAISSPLQSLVDLVICLLIHAIFPAMMKITLHLWVSLKQLLDAAITLHTYWRPQCSIWIHRLKHQRSGGKSIQILMITTPIQWRLAVHCSYRISQTADASKRKRT